MEKLWVMMIIALVVVSVLPLVVAEEGNDNETSGNSREKEDNKKGGEQWREQKLEWKQERQDKLEVRKQEREGVKELRKEERETRKQGREEMKRTRGELRDKIKNCEEDDTISNDNCQAIKEEFKVNVVDQLADVVNEQISFLTKVREHIAASDVKNKEEILASIDERLEKLKGLEDKIATADPAAEPKEIKSLVKDVRDSWKESRHEIKIRAGQAANAGLHGIVVRSQKLQEKLANIIEKMQEKGFDIAGAVEQKAVFDNALANAGALEKEAAEKLAAAQDDVGLKAAQDVMKAARAKLQEAHTALKAFVAAVRAAQADQVLAGEQA